MTASLSDLLQIWGFEKDYIVFADGSLGFALECVPVDPSTWSNDRANNYSERVSQFLNSIPSDVDIQFVQDIVPGNSKVLDAHNAIAETSRNEMAKVLAHERVNRFRKIDLNGDLPVHELKIFVRKPLSRSLVDKPKLFSKEKLFPKIAESRFESELHAMERLRENIVQGLEAIEISARVLSSDQVAALLYQQWNPSRRLPFKSYNPEEVRQSLLFSDVGVNLEGFVVGSTHFRVISLKTLPDETYSIMASALRSLPFKSRLFVTVHVPDQMKEIESLQTQRRIAYSMVAGKRTGVSDLESNAKFQDLETLLEQMVSDGQKVFHVSVQVLLQSEDESDLENQVDSVLGSFREMGGAEGLTETLAAFEIFSQIALPNARSEERSRKVKTGNLCDLIPIYGPWPGHQRPSILLKSRAGSLVSFNVFDPSMSNSNVLLSGASGSGKSVLINILILQMLKENPKVFFIDIGGSYKKLAENLGGQYVDLGVNDFLSINPFDLQADETVPSSHKIKFLVGLVELMTKEEGAERLPRLARAEVEDAIQTVYRNNPRPRMSDLKDILLAHPDKEIQTYGKILTPWCGNTPYGKFLDRETSISLQSNVMAFDLKNLESYPDLQSICLYVITDLVWREVQRDRSQMKFIVFDECWKLLKNEAGQIFLEEIFRTVRKYFCSALAVSQSLNDFLDSNISSALLPNCAMKFILMQSQNDFTRMKESLGLNDNETQLIQSLRQQKGEYSEVFIVAGQERHTVGVVEPTPLELWIATTDPRDLAALERTKKEKPEFSLLECLRFLSEKYPKGISASQLQVVT